MDVLDSVGLAEEPIVSQGVGRVVGCHPTDYVKSFNVKVLVRR